MTRRLALAGFAVVAAFASHVALAHHSHHTADKLAAALVGAAIISAIDDGDKHQHHQSHSGYSQPTYNPGSYRPQVGVICYPRLEVCESVYGNYDAAWTYKEFGG
ncbi:hypothetical protein [Halochromatium sp.]